MLPRVALQIEWNALMLTMQEQLERALPFKLTGSVSRLVGSTAAVAGFPAPLGSICRIARGHGDPIEAAVVGFQGEETLLLSFDELSGVRRGNRVTLSHSAPMARVGPGLLGRVIDARGRFIDGRPPAVLSHRVSLNPSPTRPLSRPRIDEPLGTGIRVVDSLLTCGKGQRLGIFSGSGVGKSTFIGQMARSSAADVNVVILVGERGREVREFLERDLGPEGLKRSVVVVATGDEPALLRLQAAFWGTAIAEYFRDSGNDVLLMMDSVTRFALAQREIGLAAGEPPATRGYPPSVFSLLPRLLERTGRTERGSITGFYTVLVEGDDTNEPISDTVRGTLDGHIVLSRKLAQQSHWPAIDVLASISRSMSDITDDGHRAAADGIKRLMAAWQQSEDMITIGAYQGGSNPLVDLAIRMHEPINAHLQQDSRVDVSYAEAIESLYRVSAAQNGLNRSPEPVAVAAEAVHATAS
jgi:FliI/YscN family ATPase